jgi:hypothetical protein
VRRLVTTGADHAIAEAIPILRSIRRREICSGGSCPVDPGSGGIARSFPLGVGSSLADRRRRRIVQRRRLPPRAPTGPR